MYRHVARRLLLLIPTLLGMSIIVFMSVRLLPGDIIDVLTAGDLSITDEQLRQVREQLGLTGSYPEQYLRWLGDAVRGDFGVSLRNTTPVSETLGVAIPITLEIVLLGLLIATAVGVPLGVISAVRRDSSRDYASRLAGLIGISIPSFWLATLLLLFTSRVFGWVPPFSYVSPFDDPWVNFQQFILPALSVSVFTMAIVMRMVRATMLEVLSQDYVRTAQAKGLNEVVIALRHALPNAMLPILTILGLRFGQILAGAIVVEGIFSWPGMGSAVLSAISSRDLPVISAYVLLAGVFFVIVNLLTDLSYVLLDPRIRLGASGRS